MSKKSSTKKFILMTIVALIGILLSVFSFNIPFTNYKFNGFMNAIKLGLDLKGGVEAVYEASEIEGSTSDFNKALDATVKRLSDIIINEGYTEAVIVKQGINRIRVEVPDIADPADVIKMIGEPAKLEIRKEKNTSAEVFLTGQDIELVEASYQQTSGGTNSWGVILKFNSHGKEIFKQLTTELAPSSGYLYIYIGETENPLAIQVGTVISDGKSFISGDNMDTQAKAEEYALKLLSGTFSVELELLSNNVVSATLGKDALFYSIIAGIVGLILIFIFMYLIYGEFGLLANFSLIFYIILLFFFLQAIPFVQLTLPGIAGIILSIGMAIDGNVIIFERIKDEYRAGKKIPACVKAGFKKATSTIFDANITTIMVSLVLYILGTGAIRGFAIVLLIGVAISMFTSLVLTRSLIKWYLPFNSTKPKRLRLKREVDINEIG